jgi:hypothetical protein
VNDLGSFKKKVGIGALTLVLLHLVLSVSVILIPGQRIKTNMVGALYNQLILLGPFFQETRIKASPHVYVRYTKNGMWTPFRDYGKENFSMYKESPWRYRKLHVNDFERYISNQIRAQRNFRNFDQAKNSRAFRELNQYVLQELIRMPVDSVNVLYGLNMFLPASKTFRFDTIFNYRYNPIQVAASKK